MQGFIYYLFVAAAVIIPAAILCIFLGVLGAPAWAIALFFLWPRPAIKNKK